MDKIYAKLLFLYMYRASHQYLSMADTIFEYLKYLLE
jgi:hypothetical protein